MENMISVIIPVYKVEKYIERCVRSVISQTYKNLEIILVDDCGGDSSISIAETILKNSEGKVNYRIEYHNINRGLSAARNTGLDVAKGKYVYFLDSDDRLPENALNVLVYTAEKYMSQCVVGEYADCRDTTGEVLSVPYKYVATHHHLFKEGLVEQFVNNKIPITAWNKLVEREFVLSNNLYFETGIYHEDCLWTFRLISLLTSLSIVPQVTYYYSINPDGIMKLSESEKIQRRIESSIVVLDKMHETVDMLQGEIREKMLMYVDETKNYMYRKLFLDGMTKDDFRLLYVQTWIPIRLRQWLSYSLKQKVGHLDQLLPVSVGYYYFLFLNKFLYKK